LPVGFGSGKVAAIRRELPTGFIRWEKAMPVQMKRMYLDFVARDYKSNNPQFEIVSGSSGAASQQADANYEPYKKDDAFTLRCFLSLRGEANPAVHSGTRPPTKASSTATEATIYQYDWAFGITLVDGFHWDWMNELPEEGALAIHLVLKPDPFANGPEAIPVAAVLSTLHPSRDTKGFVEQYLPTIMKGASGMAKIGAKAFAPLNYLSSGLALGSNLLASSTGDKQNWFLYQFFDEKQQCPVVEWRINKTVLREFGPLIRGTLLLAFQTPAESNHGSVQVLLRPQIRYYPYDAICYIIPTNGLKPEDQVFIEVHPMTDKAPSA
jgi:hypothetical protein